MSSNDQIVIIKRRGKYEVHHNYCVDNEFKPNKFTLEGKRDTLVEAIRYAKELCNEYPYVEYGFNVWSSALT